jgi:hypothetical protein
VTPEQARAAVLVLPDVTEADHHGRPSFRVAGRILATVPGPGLLNVMVDESEARAAVAESPRAVSLVWWGRRVAAVQVELEHVRAGDLAELLEEGWRRAAARRARPRTAGEMPSGDDATDRRTTT